MKHDHTIDDCPACAEAYKHADAYVRKIKQDFFIDQDGELQRRDGWPVATEDGWNGWKHVQLDDSANPMLAPGCQIVAICAIGSPPPLEEIQHLDGDRDNFNLFNLRFPERPQVAVH